MEYDFSDIRPYRDDEIPAVLARLLDDEEFLRVIFQFRLKWLPNWAYPLVKPLLVDALRKRTAKMRNVDDFQLGVERYMDRCMLDTTRQLEVSLAQPLDPSKSYLFMSNHRDIVMDPAICNLVRHHSGYKTHRIAIGDNLLTKPFATDLMRLNKSFIVKRSVEGRREKLKELKKLSAYMRYSIMDDNESVWIAQREGRAKDGLDKTDSALIKMLMLSKPKEQSFADGISDLHIVPVSISYEWDPCDVAKAKELTEKARTGSYEKAEHEDIESIASGIGGWKGRVDLHFGTEISGDSNDYENADDVVAEVDRQIITGYRIQPSNAVAYQQLEGRLPEVSETWPSEELVDAREQLAKRLQQLSDDLDAQSQLLRSYANPIYARLAAED